MRNPSIETAGSEHGELADAVRRAIPAFIDRWETAVRQLNPDARRQSSSQLRDDLPGVLSHLAEWLETGRPDGLREEPAVHGATRFKQGYDLSQVLVELQLLRKVTVAAVVESLGRPMRETEAEALHAGLDLVVRRTVEQFVEQLQEQLEEANTAHRKYLSFVSHDLRGSLNGIVLTLEVLRRDLQKHPQFAENVEDLELMRRSILESVATMDRLLQTERLRRGDLQLRVAPIGVSSLLNEMSRLFARRAEDKGLKIEVQAPAEAAVLSDRDLITLVLHNLISNAIKYTEKGTITLRAEPCEEKGRPGCSIEVIDQGPGIDLEAQKTLFQAFRRGEHHGQSGVGLGLSIAHEAATALGATLSVESRPGAGATFRLRLPEAKE